MWQLWKTFRLLKIYIRSISGQSNIPAGPCIVASNHEGPLDSSFIMLALKRDVHFVAGRHLLKAPGLIGWYNRQILFSIGRAIPTGERCTETCRNALASGQTVGIFPEGDIHPALRQGRIHTGAVVLSHLTQLSILPIHIENSGRVWPIHPLWKIKFWRWRTVRIAIGQPVTPPARHQQLTRIEYQRLSDELLANIANLRHNNGE